MFSYDNGIFAIDARYERSLLAAIHLIVDDESAAIVDTGTAASVPHVLAALGDLGFAPRHVRYVLLTHIHLDHAGGAGAMMQACPNAELVVHPRGARHMEKPFKLWEATVAVYGEREARRMYGELVPIDAARIRIAEEGFELALGTRVLRFLDTPGHAKHHVAIADSRSGHVFAGDTFGISYRELDQGDRQFIFPTSSPTQFDPDAAHRSIDRIAAAATGGAVYLTHFSQVRDLPTLSAALHRLVDAYRDLALAHPQSSPDRLDRLRSGMRTILSDEARRRGFDHPDRVFDETLSLDIDLNAQGLVAWLDQR